MHQWFVENALYIYRLVYRLACVELDQMLPSYRGLGALKFY
jgi:hypothetical protein